MIVYCLSPARKYFVHEKEDVTIASEGLEDVGLLLGIYGLFIVLRLLYYCPGACILNDHTRSPCNSLRMQRSTFIHTELLGERYTINKFRVLKT